MPGLTTTTTHHLAPSISTSASLTATHVLNLLSTYGADDDDDCATSSSNSSSSDSVSQIAHSLQTAHFAAKETSDPETLVAALLHDIGQFIPMAELTELAMEVKDADGNLARIGHETLGAEYLHRLGFSGKVCALVAAHVPAKRFLCKVDRGYYAGLSAASRKSLSEQGGPMSEREVDEWKRSGWWEDKVRLRRCDDRAKVVGLAVDGVQAYRGVLEAHLRAQGLGD
ncbi:hypothetical protein LTS18_001548 [Coniosporium uncinatum]|uniref:Uncharacterized protein n=1 Tax=Coniosporium uncinatum TaxID=93489 RepID=A0ACC3DBU9_9PEZI|nr:hypothetical protein LTS18_001548 [Coniosporium uncinatum]